MSGISKTLALKLTVNPSQFNAGLDGAGNKAKGFGAGLAGMFSGAARGLATFGLAVNGIKSAIAMVDHFVHDQIAQTDKISKAARRMEMDPSQLVGLEHAAQLAGVATEDLDGALAMLSKKLGMAKIDPAFAKSFEKVGLDAKKLTEEGIGEAFLEIADKIKSIESPAERAGTAFLVFGKKGQAVLDLLAEGREGIQKSLGEASRLGLTFTKEQGEGIEELSDNIDRLSAAWTGLRRQVLVTFGDDFDKVVKTATEGLVGFREQTTGFANEMKDSMAVVWVTLDENYRSFGEPAFEAAKAQLAELDVKATSFSDGLLLSFQALEGGVAAIADVVRGLGGTLQKYIAIPFAQANDAAGDLGLAFLEFQQSIPGNGDFTGEIERRRKASESFKKDIAAWSQAADEAMSAGFGFKGAEKVTQAFDRIRDKLKLPPGDKNPLIGERGQLPRKLGFTEIGSAVSFGPNDQPATAAVAKFSPVIEKGSREAFEMIMKNRFGGAPDQQKQMIDQQKEANRQGQKQVDLLRDAVELLRDGLNDDGLGIP